MPYKDPARQRAYQRQYVRGNRAAFLAGKACVDCGSTADLEVDHIDPAQKIDHRLWSWAKHRRDRELAKCVVRCRPCHQRRHASERPRHGAGGYKRGCRCVACRAWKDEATRRERDARRGRDSNPGERLCRPLPSHSATTPRVQEAISSEVPDAAA